MAFGLRSRSQNTSLKDKYRIIIQKESEEKERIQKLLTSHETEIKKLKRQIKNHEETIAKTEELLNPILPQREIAERFCDTTLLETIMNPLKIETIPVIQPASSLDFFWC